MVSPGRGRGHQAGDGDAQQQTPDQGCSPCLPSRALCPSPNPQPALGSWSPEAVGWKDQGLLPLFAFPAAGWEHPQDCAGLCLAACSEAPGPCCSHSPRLVWSRSELNTRCRWQAVKSRSQPQSPPRNIESLLSTGSFLKTSCDAFRPRLSHFFFFFLPPSRSAVLKAWCRLPSMGTGSRAPQSRWAVLLRGTESSRRCFQRWRWPEGQQQARGGPFLAAVCPG